MRIEILGHVCLDTNTSENASYTAAGGPGTFMERVFTQFPDVEVEMAASYGPDLASYISVPIYPTKPNLQKSLLHENVSGHGDKKTIVGNKDADVPPKLTPELKEKIKDSDILFFTPLTPNLPSGYIQEVIELTKQDCLKVLLPQGYFWGLDANNVIVPREFSEAKEILPLMDIAIVGDHDYPDIVGIAREWTANNNLISVVTLGNKGAVAFARGEEIMIPTEPVHEKDIVDTVGSGDIFSAGFAYKYKQTEDVKDAGRFANELARQALFYRADEIKINVDLLK